MSIFVFEAFKKGLKKIENEIRTISFDYKRKIINTYCNDLVLLEQSLIYRNGSIGFHLDLIENFINQQKEILREVNKKGGVFPKFSFPEMRMTYLIDDLIFNMFSFYDYYATYVFYVFYGEDIRSEAEGYDPLSFGNENLTHILEAIKKISWIELEKFVKGNPKRKAKLSYNQAKIENSKIKKVIIERDQFVSKLRELRNDIIHNKISPISKNPSFNPINGSKYTFFVGAKFIEIFPEIDKELEGAISFIVDQFIQGIKELNKTLISEIEKNRLVKKEEMFMKWEHEL